MIRLFPHSLHIQYSLFPKKLRWLFVGHLIRGVADQAIGLFIPIFLFTRAQQLSIFSLTALSGLNELQRGIVLIASYYFLSHAIELLLMIPMTKVMKRLGLVRSMMLGNVLTVVLYLLFFGSQFNPLFLLLAAVLDGTSTAMYWIPYFTEFAVQADLKKIGSEVGGALFLEQLLRAAMPMLGGALIMSFGFGSSYLTAAVLFMFASLTLFFIPEVSFSYEVTLKDFQAWCKKKSFLPTVLGFAGKYIDDATFYIWPVFVLLFLGNIQRVGYVYTIVLFISLILSYFMGWYLGKHRSAKLFNMSGSVIGIIWVCRIFVTNIWNLLLADTMDRLMLCIYTPIFETYFIRKSRGKHVFHFHVYREMLISCVSLLFWPVVVSMFMFPFGWGGLFVLAGIGVVLSLYMQGGQLESK